MVSHKLSDTISTSISGITDLPYRPIQFKHAYVGKNCTCDVGPRNERTSCKVTCN